MQLRNGLAFFFPQENACHLCQRWAQEGILCSRCAQELSRQMLAPGRQTLVRRDGLYLSIACWKHQGLARRLVHLLKYQTDPKAAEVLAQGMVSALRGAQAGAEDAPLVIPVPLHPERESARGYNQAALLARHICQATGFAMQTDVLYRTRSTGTLVKLDREARLNAMRGAFAVASAQAVRGKRILLVDDVFTTGATSLACAEALGEAGAEQVCILTACRA